MLRHLLHSKIQLIVSRWFSKAKHIDLLAGFIKIIVKDDLHVTKNLCI